MLRHTYRRLSCKCQDTVRPVSDRKACFKAKQNSLPSITKTAFFLSDGPPTCISQAAKRTGTVPGRLRGWERSDFTIFMTAKRTGGRHDGLRRRKRQGVWGFLAAKRTGTVPGGLRGMASPAIWLKIAGLVDIAHWRLSAGGIAC